MQKGICEFQKKSVELNEKDLFIIPRGKLNVFEIRIY